MPRVQPTPDPITLPMQITLYRRSFAIKGGPVSLSLVPFATSQKCTFPVGDKVYEAKFSEVKVIAPDDAKIDVLRNRLVWGTGKGRMNSTASEVHDLALAGTSGFKMAK